MANKFTGSNDKPIFVFYNGKIIKTHEYTIENIDSCDAACFRIDGNLDWAYAYFNSFEEAKQAVYKATGVLYLKYGD